MSGLVTKHSELRYGSEDDTIFPKSIGNITLQIINFTNTDSHTNEEHPYTIDDKDLEISESEKELYFSYVLQLCHVIKSFGAFVDKHPDKEANRKMKRTVSTSVPSINDFSWRKRTIHTELPLSSMFCEVYRKECHNHRSQHQ